MQPRIWTSLFALMLLSGLWAMLPGAIASAHEETSDPPLLGNLGNYHRAITTNSQEAQAYFDQGLVLAYGFNHDLAIQSFKAALHHDPACAMCYWGIAWALGPNINLAMDPAQNADAWSALQQAQQLARNASPVEQAFINALAARYSEATPDNRAELDLAFAAAMGKVVEAYPDDADALSIYAEAMMDLMPWNYWTPDGKSTEYTDRILKTLEAALKIDPNHPAANHYYIHATEASQDPGRALLSAQRLETLVPGAGHLVHMPAHTYWRIGRYADAVRVNKHAAHTDETAAAGRPDPGSYNFYSLAYYPHNIHFLSVAAQMMGDSATAISAARRLVEAIPEQAYHDMPFFEDFRPMPYQALVRFGRWQAMVDEPAPGEQLPFATAIWHYARGVALANLGRIDEAKAELAAVKAAKHNPALTDLVMASFATAQQNLDMAVGILSAAIAHAEGDHKAAVAHLETAVAIQDSLAYIEPPAWYFPIRELLGSELMADGQAEQAEAVYRQDLVQYPINGWSLFGLTQALAAQGKTADAEITRSEFENAWRGSDIVLTSSACPCALAAGTSSEAVVDEATLIATVTTAEANASGHNHTASAAGTTTLGGRYMGIMENGDLLGPAYLAAATANVTGGATTKELDKVKAVVIAPNAVLLVYPETTVTSAMEGQTAEAKQYVASLWIKQAGIWQHVLVQPLPIAMK